MSLSPAVITDLSRSPHARLKPVPLEAVCLRDEFWQPRRERNGQCTLPSQFEELRCTGRLDNFRRAAGEDFPHSGTVDADVHKWMEAVAWSLAEHPDNALAEKLDAVIELVARAQQPGGYLCTTYSEELADRRWQNLEGGHELYCGGHLIQAAIAHHRTTAQSTLLDVATKWADLVCSTFGADKRAGTGGHAEVEMALVELYRATGERKYLDQAVYFVEARGQTPPLAGGKEHTQDHAPVREQTTVVGHAVMQYYLCSGLADIYAETGDETLLEVLLARWEDVTQHKLYATGGSGVWYKSEGFSVDYDLPNRLAYAETCASIAWVMWNWRMLNITGEARFADAMETALYNGVLSGISLRGDEYCYTNPLEHDGTTSLGEVKGSGRRSRRVWDAVACCPPNIARLLAQLPGYFYSTDDTGLWAHFFAAGRVEVELPQGRVVLEQQTGYPWHGEVTFHIIETPASEWTLHLRVPGWAKNATLEISDQSHELTLGEYCTLRRKWQAGDTVRVCLFDAPRFVQSHPYVLENTGKVAVFRGPILYCAEACDHPETDIRDLAIQTLQNDLAPSTMPGLNGITVLTGRGVLLCHSTATGALYREDNNSQPNESPANLRLVPYYAWANRAPGRMKVWLQKV